MKAIRNRFRNILQENLLLLILFRGFVVAAFLLLWKCSLNEILRDTRTAYDAERDFWNHAGTERFGEPIVLTKNQNMVDIY